MRRICTKPRNTLVSPTELRDEFALRVNLSEREEEQGFARTPVHILVISQKRRLQYKVDYLTAKFFAQGEQLNFTAPAAA